MRCRKAHLFVALAFFVVALAFFVYALTSVVYNDQADFDSGTYNRTGYFSSYLGANITLDSPFESNQSELGTVNMSGNQLLAHLDETSADTLAASEDFEDFSSNGYNGEDYGTLSYAAEGVFGNAVDFTSGAGAIDFGDIEMSTWGQITVSAWINRTGGSGNQRIVSKDRLGTPGNFIFYFNGGVLSLLVRDGGSWETLTYSPSSGGIDGDWHHVAFTVDESTNNIYLYWDGVQVDSSGSFALSSLDDSDNEEVVVGADSNVGSFGDYFTGYIDDVAIWDRALSSDEMLTIFNSGTIADETVTYSSNIEDSGVSTDWQSLAWVQDVCHGCPLPNSSLIENSTWFLDTVDMNQTILLYHFDETVLNSTADNQDFYDASGNYFHANESGDLVLSSNGGVFGGAVNFTGSEAITVGYLNLSNLTALTMSIWFNTESSSGSKRLFSKDEVGQVGDFIYWVDGNTVDLYVNQGGIFTQLNSGVVVSDGLWHHTAAVIDSSTNLVSLYLDGALVDSAAYTQDPISFPQAKHIRIGADSDVTSAYDNSFDGLLDEAAMWARGFTAEEIATLYYRGLSSSIDFNVQSCNDAACSGESYSSFSGNSPIDISSLTDNQYIQFETIMQGAEQAGIDSLKLYNVTLTDQVLDTSYTYSGESYTVGPGSRDASEDPGAETPAVVLLDSPANGTSGTDRSFEFIWNNSATENVTYDFQLSTDYSFGSTVISASGLSEENSSQTNYSTTDDLPIDDVYYWRVRAVNGITPGDWSEVREVEVLSYLAISLPATTGVDFGNLLPGQSEDTETTAGLQPIIIRNDGNYPVNITVNASSFFVNSDGAYQFKIEDNETGSYDSAFTTYTDLNSSAQQAVTSLNYENSSNSGNTVNMHLTITVPSLEPAADKTSLIEISTG